MCIYIQVLYIHKYSKGWGGVGWGGWRGWVGWGGVGWSGVGWGGVGWGGVGWGGVGWGGVGGEEWGWGVLDTQFSLYYHNSPVFTHKLLVIYFSNTLKYILTTVIRKSDSTIFK